MKITPRKEYVACGKQGELDQELTVADISRVLSMVPRNPQLEGASDGKVTIQWEFYVDGEPCGIWNYKGARWSTFGPKSAFERLFSHYYRDGMFGGRR